MPDVPASVCLQVSIHCCLALIGHLTGSQVFHQSLHLVHQWYRQGGPGTQGSLGSATLTGLCLIMKRRSSSASILELRDNALLTAWIRGRRSGRRRRNRGRRTRRNRRRSRIIDIMSRKIRRSKNRSSRRSRRSRSSKRSRRCRRCRSRGTLIPKYDEISSSSLICHCHRLSAVSLRLTAGSDSQPGGWSAPATLDGPVGVASTTTTTKGTAYTVRPWIF